MILWTDRSAHDSPPAIPDLVFDPASADLPPPPFTEPATADPASKPEFPVEPEPRVAAPGDAVTPPVASLTSVGTHEDHVIEVQTLLDAGIEESLANAVASGLDRYRELYRKLPNHKTITKMADIVFDVAPNLAHLLATSDVRIDGQVGSGRRFNYWHWTCYVDGAVFHFESQGWEIDVSIRRDVVDPKVWANAEISETAKAMPLGPTQVDGDPTTSTNQGR